jgi:hypothetical protein
MTFDGTCLACDLSRDGAEPAPSTDGPPKRQAKR